MSTASWGGTGTSVIGNTDQWVHVGGITTPAGRNVMANGIAYAYVFAMEAFVAGKGAARTIQLGFEGSGYTDPFAVPAGGSAADTGFQGSAFLTAGGTDTFRVSSNGSFYFGRGGAGGPSADSHGRSFSNVLFGACAYISAPTAPSSPSVAASSASSALVSWAYPADDGDSGVSGYRLDYSTSSTFATYTSLEVGNVTSYTVAGLLGSTTYYFRLFAENVATNFAHSWSQPTSTMSLTTSASGLPPTATVALTAKPTTAITYPMNSCGFWGFWLQSNNVSWFVSVATAGTFGGATLLMGVDPTVGFWASTTTGTNPMTDGPSYRLPGGMAGEHHYSVGVAATFTGGVWIFPLTLYVDGVQVATGASSTLTPPSTLTNAGKQPTTVQVGTLGAVGSATISRLSHTTYLSAEAFTAQGTEAAALSAVAATMPQLALGALPSDLSTAPIGYVDTASKSALDVINLIVRTEQGYLDTVTTGSLTNPVQSVRVRARQRPMTVAYSFDAQTEVLGEIDFLRDITNLIWSDVVSGANSATQTVSQTALQARAGSNNSSDTVALYKSSNLYEWGTDRLWRGQNVALRPAVVTIDNLSCPTDRSSDLLQMVPGDRIQITNIPSATLGFSTWDGWLLDKAQVHTSGPGAQDRFLLYLQPCQPSTGIYDTDLYANDSNLTISTALTSSAVSMVVASADGVTFFERTAVPYTLQIEKEQVTVTAASAPASGTQTLTIARGAGGTTASAHAVGLAPEVVTNSIFAF